MPSDDVQVNLRLPASLVAELRAAAKLNGVSLTAEVTSRLYESAPPDPEDVEIASAERLIVRLEAARARFDMEEGYARAAHDELAAREWQRRSERAAATIQSEGDRVRELYTKRNRARIDRARRANK